MRYSFRILLLQYLLLILFPGISAQINLPFIKYSETPLPSFENVARVLHCKYWSVIFGEETGYNIYLPKSCFEYPDSVFPVLYYLHGASANYMLNENTSMRYWDTGTEEGMLQETVIVFPNSVKDNHYMRDSEGTIMEELIPHIENTYRVSDCREYKSLSDFSMWGHGTIRLSFLHSDIFAIAMALAGAPYTEIEEWIEFYLYDHTDTLDI